MKVSGYLFRLLRAPFSESFRRLGQPRPVRSRAPSAYAQIYGIVKPGVPCGVVGDVRTMRLDALEAVAQRGCLRVSPPEAAAHILAASSGVTLSLIQQPLSERDLSLSDRVRDSVLAAMIP